MPDKNTLKHTSYWLETVEKSAFQSPGGLPGEVDVAIIGGGYTGLSCARTLAKSGMRVAVLECATIGWGASSRNAGITGCGLKASMRTIIQRYGSTYGQIFWQKSLDALDLVRELVEVEGIDCDLNSQGDLCVAFKPSHYTGFESRAEWHAAHLGHNLRLIPPAELRSEIGSDAFYGGILDEHGAGVNPARLVYGLAEVAQKYGAQLFELTGVNRVEEKSSGYLLQTQRGSLKADQILVATNGYTDQLVPGLSSKIFPGGSYSIVTAPLGAELQAEISPKGRVFWDSKWFLNYFRLTPDGCLLWGGRNNLSTDLDLEKSASQLRKGMLRAFPQLDQVQITHAWTGQLGLTFDLMPHIGRNRGIYYAFGYGGHGLHAALLLGREVAHIMSGATDSSPFMDIPHKTYFFYRRKPWFLPLVARYYQFTDWIS